jgi:uncharacterized membrane protein YdjX (TVP38/TMEM64 family)
MYPFACHMQLVSSRDITKECIMETQTPKKENTSHQSKIPLYISILLVGSLIASYFLLPSFQQFLNEAYQVLTSDDKQKISQWVSQYGWWGPVIIIFAMVAQMFLLVIPTVLLMVISVVAYGPVWGIGIILAGIVTASSVGYMLGALLGPVTVSRLIGDKTEQKIEHYVEQYGFWAVIITRISPFLSNDAISFVGGLLRMGYLKFIGATLLGILPLALLIAYLGESNNRLMNGLIWVSAVSLVIFIGYIVYDRMKKRRMQHKGA